MWENRSILIKRKSILILDKRFPIFESLIVGDSGQASFSGIIEGEELSMQNDGTELLMKTIRLNKIENINNKIVKVSIKDK